MQYIQWTLFKWVHCQNLKTWKYYVWILYILKRTFQIATEKAQEYISPLLGHRLKVSSLYARRLNNIFEQVHFPNKKFVSKFFTSNQAALENHCKEIDKLVSLGNIPCLQFVKWQNSACLWCVKWTNRACLVEWTNSVY